MDGLWRVNVAGGTPVRIPVAGNAPSEPTLRGKRLAYVQQGLDPNIWAIRTSGTGQAVQLVASTRSDAGPQCSPDGSRIAFCSEQSGSQEIWVARSDGSRQEKLTSFGSGQSCTSRWSPDSLQLVFDSNAESAQFEIYRMNADGGRLKRLNISSWHGRHWELLARWTADLLHVNPDRTGGNLEDAGDRRGAASGDDSRRAGRIRITQR